MDNTKIIFLIASFQSENHYFLCCFVFIKTEQEIR